MIDSLYRELKDGLVELRVNPRPFQRDEICDDLNDDFAFCETYFVGLKFSRPQGDAAYFDLRPTVSQFCLIVDVGRIDKSVSDVRILHLTKQELSP